MLEYDPTQRATAAEMLKHPWVQVNSDCPVGLGDCDESASGNAEGTSGVGMDADLPPNVNPVQAVDGGVLESMTAERLTKKARYPH